MSGLSLQQLLLTLPLGLQLTVSPTVPDPYSPESHILPTIARADAFQKANKAGVVKSVAFYAYYAFCATSTTEVLL